MGDVVNLNRFRKSKEKAEAERTARTNRTRFGRTKAEKELEQAREDLARRRLEMMKLDPDGDPPDRK